VPNNFCYVYCSAYGSSPCFNAHFFCAAVKESDARKDIVHYRFLSNQDCVDLWHAFASLLVYFLSGLSKDFFKNKYIVVQPLASCCTFANWFSEILVCCFLIPYCQFLKKDLALRFSFVKCEEIAYFHRQHASASKFFKGNV